MVNCQNPQPESKRIKRRRRRKLDSKTTDGSVQNGTASEYTEDDFSSVEEEEEGSEKPAAEDHSTSVSPPTENQTNENSETEVSSFDSPETNQQANQEAQTQNNDPEPTIAITENSSDATEADQEEKKDKYELKPDAQEFVPRAMRPENVQYLRIQPGFVQVPLMSPMGHPAYLPPGMPLGYIPPNPAIYPGYMPGYIPAFNPEHFQAPLSGPPEEIPVTEPEAQPEPNTKNDIDIRTVVSKLEEVANEPQKPDRKNHHSNPYKKTGQPYYEERKKFFNKNNNQNGFYKRPNRYQTIHKNEINSNGHSQIDSINSKIEEDPIAENVQEERQIAPENPPAEQRKPIESQHEQQETTQQSVQHKPNITITNGSSTGPSINPEKPLSSPKFQQRPTNFTSEASKSTNVENNHQDTRKRWVKRDEKTFQKRDSPVSDDRSNQNYKPNDSPRFNRSINTNSPTANQRTYFPIENSKRYSETVKKTSPSTTNKPVVRESPVKIVKDYKPVKPEVTNTQTNKTQWISVSSKKKRRNRNVEDSENGSETPVLEEDEEKQPEPQVQIQEFQQNEFLQNMINAHKDEETQSDKVEEKVPEVIRKSPVKILEVRDLEKELLSNVGVEIKDESESIIAEVRIVEPTKQKSSSKKKSKKSVQKPIKRVFITDLDLSGLSPEHKKEEVKETVKETKTTVPQEVKQIETKEVVIEQEDVKEEIVTPIEPTEKKNKKKKKKSKAADVVSNTQLNSEDAYDLLLENTLSHNSEDKTNMEISQELDLIIQRGMYSSLEEKIKALNIIPIKEEFFQSVVRTSRESSTEKSPEFSKLLANSMPKFKYCMASVEDDFNQPSTSRTDLFVENQEVNQLLNDIYGKEGTPEAEIGELVTRASPPKEVKIESVKEKSVEKTEVKKEVPAENGVDQEKLYPITQAVKNWMSKTRENTPEVEILKSPSKIFKEFRDMEEEGLANGKRNSAISESDEEITVYSASRNDSDAVDLLDCWENEISSESERQTSIDEDVKIRDEDEDVLVYESKYGQNEDFLELQREIEEKKKQEQDARSRNFPKHGALPYRAICCNVM